MALLGHIELNLSQSDAYGILATDLPTQSNMNNEIRICLRIISLKTDIWLRTCITQRTSRFYT